MCSSNLRDRIVAILREPLRIKRLCALIIEDVFESVLLQKADRVFELGGQFWIIAINDRIDVFLEKHFKQRSRSAACTRAQGTGDFGRKVPENGDDAVRITRERFQKMPVTLRPVAWRKIGPVFV
jgi:hypothetical protein